jgi:O-antigen/teichoic acid export membrane protein
MTSARVSRRTLARNLATSWGSLIVDLVVTFTVTPIVVTRLGADAYGIWSLAIGVVGYLGLVDLGIRGGVGRYVNYYMARRDAHRVNEVVCTSALALTAVALVVLVVSVPLGLHFAVIFPKTPAHLHAEVSMAVPLLTAGLWCAFQQSVFRSVAEARDRFDLANALAIGGAAARGAGTVLVLQQGGGLAGLAAFQLLLGIVLSWAQWLLARRVWPELRLSAIYVSVERFREIWKFGIAAFASRAASMLTYQSTPLIVMWFLGPSAVAVMSLASMLVQNARRVIEVVYSVHFPSIMKAGAVQDTGELRHQFLVCTRISMILGGLAYVGLIVFGKAFFTLWVGSSYESAAIVAALLAMGELATLPGNTGAAVLYSLGEVRFNVVLAVTEAAIAVIGVTALLAWSGFGLYGAAAATAVAAGAMRGLVLGRHTLRRIAMDAREFVRGMGARWALLLVIAVCVFGVLREISPPHDWWSFVIVTAASAALYAVAALLLMVPAETRQVMAARIRLRN